jgi:hypothetical protein
MHCPGADLRVPASTAHAIHLLSRGDPQWPWAQLLGLGKREELAPIKILLQSTSGRLERLLGVLITVVASTRLRSSRFMRGDPAIKGLSVRGNYGLSGLRR